MSQRLRWGFVLAQVLLAATTAAISRASGVRPLELAPGKAVVRASAQKASASDSAPKIPAADRNFLPLAGMGPNAPPIANAIATNLSAAGRSDKTNYYGDKWQLQDASTSNLPITRIDWDFNYNGAIQVDESGSPTFEGIVTGYFPCDLNGVVAGTLRTGVDCIQSLGLTNPPASFNYRFAMQSANQDGTSANVFVSSAIPVACPQASIAGYAEFMGSCMKSGGTLTVARGGYADSSASMGNLQDASFNWSFAGTNPISVQGKSVPVPNGATGFAFTVTFPGGYQATASGTVTIIDSTPILGIFTDPAAMAQAFFGGNAYQLMAGTTYYLKDVETAVPPSARFFFNSGFGDVELPGSPTLGPGPLGWTPSSACASGCSAKVNVGTASDSKLVVISPPAEPTPVPTPVPTPTPPPGGSVTVSVAGPTSGSRNVVLTFTANASGGSGNYSYSWTCDYNSIFPAFSTGTQTWTCTYSAAGTYIVKVQVADASSGSTALSAAYPVTITGGLPAPSSAFTLTGPTVTFNTFSGYVASTGSPVTFTATETETNVSSYAWDFGDGSPAGFGKSVTHTYNTAGRYAAHLTVTGNETTTTGTTSAAISLSISGPPAPSAAYTVSGAAKTGQDAYEVEAGKTVMFTALEVNAKSYLWDFGDGAAATGKSVTKAWSTVAFRTVFLVVTGDGTNTLGSASASISVNVISVKFKAIIVPGAAHLDLGASVWATDVTVANPGNDALKISPFFVPYLDGSPDTFDLSQVPDNGQSFQLDSGASWSRVDVVKLLGDGSNKGTLVFRYEGTADPVVTARVYFASASDPQGGSYGAAFPSYKITGSGGVSTQQTEEAVPTDQTLIGLRSDELYRFRVTLYNADSRVGTFRLTAFDQNGNQKVMKDATGQFVGFRDFKIGPYQQASPSDADLGLTDASVRYVLKASQAPSSSTGTLIASGTALDRKTSDLVQITDDTPSTLAESGLISYYIPAVSHLDTTRAQWRTDLRIFNKSSSPRLLAFEYFFTKGGGGPEELAQVAEISIPGNGLLTYDDVVDSLLKQDTTKAADLAGNTAGLLRVSHLDDADSATKPLVIGSRNYDDPSDGTGTAGTQLAVYSALESTKPGSPALTMAGPEDSDRFYSLVGLFAIDSAPTAGTITAFGSDGNPIGSFDFVLNQPGGTGHFGQVFLGSLNGWSNPGTPVTVRVSVAQGGRVGGYAVTVDKKTNDLTFIQGHPRS